MLLKFSLHRQLLINVIRNAALHRQGMEIAMFLPIAIGKIFLKAIRHPLGNAQRLLISHR